MLGSRVPERANRKVTKDAPNSLKILFWIYARAKNKCKRKSWKLAKSNLILIAQIPNKTKLYEWKLKKTYTATNFMAKTLMSLMKRICVISLWFCKKGIKSSWNTMPQRSQIYCNFCKRRVQKHWHGHRTLRTCLWISTFTIRDKIEVWSSSTTAKCPSGLSKQKSSWVFLCKASTSSNALVSGVSPKCTLSDLNKTESSMPWKLSTKNSLFRTRRKG